MKQEKSKVRKTRGTIEKAPVINKLRTTRPKVHKKINLDPMEENVKEEDDDSMTLTQILK